MWTQDIRFQKQRAISELSYLNPYAKRVEEFSDALFSFDNPKDYQDLQKRILEITTLPGRQYIEFGSGSGAHLLALAKREPDARFFGFELRYKRSVRTVEKAKESFCQNLFVIRTKAERVEDFFPEKCVAGIYVNFPDPWEKPKRQKHRLLGKEFLDVSSRLLRSSGFIAFKTDHREYFESFRCFMQSDARFHVIAETTDFYSSPYIEGNIQTEFERLFHSQGKAICYLRAELAG